MTRFYFRSITTLFLLSFCIFVVKSQQRDHPLSVIVEKSFGLFSDAVSMSRASSGELFVLDAKPAMVYKFSPDGDELKKMGGRGWGDYEFDNPCDIAADFLLELFVVDRNNKRIQQYDRTLNFVQSYAENITDDAGGVLYPRSVTVAPQGNIFILDSDGDRILKLNTRRQVEKIFGSYSDGKGKLTAPIDIASAMNNDIVVLDDSKLIVFDYYGNYLKSIPLPEGKEWCAVSTFEKGFIAVSHSDIIAMGPDGTRLFSLSSHEIISDQDSLEFRDASIHESRFFILTPTTILDCTIVQ